MKSLRDGTCPVCQQTATTASVRDDLVTIDCTRCGAFKFSRSVDSVLEAKHKFDNSNEYSARLSYAIQRRHLTERLPYLNVSNLDDWSAEQLPPLETQINNLVRLIAEELGADRMGWVTLPNYQSVAGLIGAVDGGAVYQIFREAENLGLLRSKPGQLEYGLTATGWQRADDSAPVPTRFRLSEADRRRVFIGHGGSPVWRDLKDYLVERLGLDYEEFNREPVAGHSTKERLSKMLDEAGFAFLVMTGEDQRADGTLTPRTNVVHEAGLFQGRLGFERAIILLEEGCDDFSNVDGLGHIKFPKGNIDAIKEQIRQVLEREGIVRKP